MFLKLFCQITCIKKDNEFLRVKFLTAAWIYIAGKGSHSHLLFSRSTPFLKIIPFLEIQMSPPFIGLSGKQKYCMKLLTNFCINSTHKVF